MVAIRGSIQHIKGDRWRVRVYMGQTPSGKQQTQSISFRAETRKAAERKAVPLLQELHRRADAQQSQKGTVAELAREWMELKRRQGRSPATLQSYEPIVDRIVARFGRLPLDRLTAREIDRWYGELLDERGKDGQPVRTAATVQKHHSILRAMLRQAERWDMVAKVATRQATVPTAVRPEVRPPTTQALDAIIQAAGDGEFGCLLRVMRGTGMRRGEVCGLLWSDIDGDQLHIRRSVVELEGGRLEVKSPKGRRSRTLTIGRDVVDALTRQRALIEARAAAADVTLPADGPVFPDPAGRPYGVVPRRPGWVSHRWIRLRDACGSDARLHDLRHWNVSTMLDLGVPLPVAAARAGHARTSMTADVYAHAVRGSDRAAALALEQVTGG